MQYKKFHSRTFCSQERTMVHGLNQSSIYSKFSGFWILLEYDETEKVLASIGPKRRKHFACGEQQ